MFGWFENLKIAVKLRMSFSVLAAITAIIGLGGIWVMSLLDGRVASVFEQDLPAVSAIKEAGLSQLKAMRVLLRVVLAAGDTEEIDKQSHELANYLSEERNQIAICSSKLRSKDGKAQLEAAKKSLPQFEKGANDIVTAAKAGDIIGFRNTIKDLVPLSDQIQHSFDLVSQVTEKQALHAKWVSRATYWSALTIMVPIVLASFALAAGMSFFMTQMIAGPLALMVRVLDSVAKGELTQSLPVAGKDEMGQLAQCLNHALACLRATLQEVGRSSSALTATSQSLAHTAASLAEGSMTQASGLESTTSSMEQITVTIRNNAEYTSRANQLGASARETAEKGGSSIQLAISAMEEIRQSSSGISNILGAINELAFQSNLLAVNASIEAALAGESGRSFAVVASEIRHLAQRSASSAKEIEQLIATSLDRVKNGSQLVNRSGSALSEIIESVKKVSTILDEISTASMQQSQGMEHINKAINQVDGVTRENSSKTQHLSATAQELAGLAARLDQTLSTFVFEGETQQHDSSGPTDIRSSLLAMQNWIASRYQSIRHRTPVTQ